MIKVLVGKKSRSVVADEKKLTMEKASEIWFSNGIKEERARILKIFEDELKKLDLLIKEANTKTDFGQRQLMMEEYTRLELLELISKIKSANVSKFTQENTNVTNNQKTNITETDKICECGHPENKHNKWEDMRCNLCNTCPKFKVEKQ